MLVPGVLLFVLPVAPPVAVDVQLSSKKPEGKGSVIVAPVTLPGPRLLTTTV